MLTKPDRAPVGDEDRWSHSFVATWYCVKQPDSRALRGGITWNGARQAEDEFSSSTPPWSSLEGVYQKYIGTSNLTKRLSEILSDLVSKR